MSEFGRRLKEARIDASLTQDELARILDISKSTISMWENGNRIPSIDVVFPLARALKKSPGYFTGGSVQLKGGKGYPSPRPTEIDLETADYYLDPEVAQMAQEIYERPEMRVLFDASRNASPEDIEQVAALLEKLSNK